MLSPLIYRTAQTLRCKVNGVSEPLTRNGVELFPALAYFTVEDESNPAHGGTFAVKLPELDIFTLAARFNETTSAFASVQ